METRSDVRPPRIGVSSCFFHADPERAVFKGKTLLYVEESMLDLVGRSGALTYLIPRSARTPLGLDAYVADLDGLILEGGADVCPRSYGEEPLQTQWEGDEVRDGYEIELIRAFHAAGKPIFGICRGIQILNVAFGGTLYQDISTQVPNAFVHRNWDLYDSNRHSVEIVAGTHLAEVFDQSGVVTVNSVHHQGINRLADGFDVEAFSVTDDIVEAIRLRDDRFVAAVQWHPEFTSVEDDSQLPPDPLVVDFLRAVAQRQGES